MAHHASTVGTQMTEPLLASGDEAGPVPEQEEMLRVERSRCSELVAELRHLHPQERSLRSEQVGLSMSGGGTRAAAFHCGVVWSLADAGILKEVLHLASTSGGGYTASSLITHLYQMSAEVESEPSLNAWYQKVVARMVLRMQANINFLVCNQRGRLFRFSDEKKEEERGTSLGPRIFDLPLLLVCLFSILALSPLLLVIHTLWLLVLNIEIQYGEVLRSVWCDPLRMPESSELYHGWVQQRLRVTAILAAGAFALNTFFGRPSSTTRYLAFRSLRQVFERGTMAYAVYNLVVMSVLGIQVARWGSAKNPLIEEVEQSWVRTICHRYIMAASSGAVGFSTCSDWNPITGEYWYEHGGSLLYLNQTWATAHAAPPPGIPSNWSNPVVNMSGNLEYVGGALASLGFAGLTFFIIGMVVLGGTLVKWFLTLLFPAAYLAILTGVARWQVYGPLTGQALLSTETGYYTHDLATSLLRICVAAAIVTLPFYDTLLKMTHFYYRRALRQAYFHGGEDVSVAALASCPYCPNMIFGTCLHDFRLPENKDNFCQFSITSLFLGSDRTGYFFTPSRARLAHLLTVTGAATDAALLTANDTILVRMFLAVVSLRLGDFLRLKPHGQTAVGASKKIRRALTHGLGWMGKVKNLISQEEETTGLTAGLQGLLDRLPSALPILVLDLLLLAGATSPDCMVQHGLIPLSFIGFIAVMVLSYFAHLRPLRGLARSPLVQQFLMLTMHRYKAPEPPPYVYISDGGLLEVLGLLPLLRRRLPIIIVSDAGHDPNLSMRCLRDAATAARDERLCSIFDPRDPRRDLEYILQDLRDGDGGFLRLGIHYEPKDGHVEGSQPQLGELFYVRMRLPPGDMAPARRLLTEQDLLTTPQPAASAPVEDGLLRKDLGGVCCECGDSVPGEQFPNFGMGNQFLTPLHFANLCGLGAELSQPLTQALRSRLASKS